MNKVAYTYEVTISEWKNRENLEDGQTPRTMENALIVAEDLALVKKHIPIMASNEGFSYSPEWDESGERQKVFTAENQRGNYRAYIVENGPPVDLILLSRGKEIYFYRV
ncbi:MAG: hypothetical protein KKF68_03645 [Nanoarchaeota archaeon]|nr:hypothetical protein [Nanoarchaeota archaeon]